MAAMDIDFELSGLAYGHSSDVRDVVALTHDTFASCSRDGTIRFWKRHADNTLTEHKMVMGHQSVHKMGTRALLYVPPGRHPIFKDGALVSGGSDKVILVWDTPTWLADEKEPLMHLLGHLDNITSLSLATNGDILSGSSDTTAHVWRGNTTIHELKGHKAPVWSVIALQNGDIATGSGDRTIKVWRNGVCINTLTEHGDSVRGLADVPGIGFLSASNDSTVKFFSYDGTLLQTLEGHEGFVYDVKVLPNGDFASASEDGTVRIWRDFNCIQVLRHPVGVWRITVTDDGDVISACQDGIIRAFSRIPERKASEDVIKQYRDEIANADKKKAVGDLDLSVLPGPEALLIQGSSDGETKMIKQDGKAFIYTWSIEKKEWIAMGEIMDAKDTQKGKQMAYGKAFDHVWDVEIGDGGPMKKIGYNDGDNPYLAAQDFIAQNSLDQNFLEDIAKFIIRNVGDSAAKAVGKQRPAGNSNSASPSTPSSSAKSSAPGAPQIPPSSSKHFPVLKPVLFEAANFEQISSKFKASNDELTASANEGALNLEEAALVDAILKKLSQTRFYHVSSFSDKELASIEKALLKWPLDKLPVVLDALRVMALHPAGARRFLEGKVLLQILSRATADGGHPANLVLAFRLVSNCFALDSSRSSLLPYAIEVADRARAAFVQANANAKLAIATALLNFSALTLLGNSTVNASKVASVCLTLLDAAVSNDADGELSYILLAALGTSAYWNSDVKSSLKSSVSAATLSTLSNSPNAKTKEAAVDVIQIFK